MKKRKSEHIISAMMHPTFCCMEGLVGLNFGQVQWGPVSAWVGTILTVGTLYVSLRLYRRDWRDRHREQAKKFNAWVAGVNVESRTVEVEVLNSSDAPVYDVHISVLILFNSHPFYYRWYGTFSPHVSPPRKESEVLVLRSKLPLPDESVNPPFTIPRAVTQVSFTDTSGAKWQRSPDGRLREVRRLPSVSEWLMDRYGMWPPFGKDHKWWVTVLDKTFFKEETLSYVPRSGWKYIKTPAWVKEQDGARWRNGEDSENVAVVDSPG